MDNIDILIKEAEGGNTGAMLELATYYHKENDNGSSMKWADRAAEAGSVGGYHFSMLLHRMMIEAASALAAWDLLETEANTVIERAAVLSTLIKQKRIDADPDLVEAVRDSLGDGAFGKALAIYMKEETEDFRSKVIDLVKEIDTTEANLLHGACAFQLENYADAFSLLNRVYADIEYRTRNKVQVQEAIFSASMNVLAMMYRVGVPGVVNPDLSKSVEILTQSLVGIQKEDFKEPLQNELRKYQKKLFGGYRYIE